MTSLRKPMALTMGDPAGVGPEIIAASLAKHHHDTRYIVLGCPNVMNRAVDLVGAGLTVRARERLDDAEFDAGTVEVLQTGLFDEPPVFGEISAACGDAAYNAIRRAIECAITDDVCGIVTAPINKAALSLARINFPGHTEMLAHHGGVDRVAMMLGNEDIRTVLVTIHCSLTDAIKGADYPAQMSAIRLAHEGARALGIDKPRVAVAGLNPHAGENGLFGQEEVEIISPAIAAARKEGIDATGPWPGDTVFMQARKGQFDIVVAQYHDQGLIPVKYMGLEKGVNITLGLPFVRTSPDHGTAFDIAGQGIADASSFQTALAYANQLVAAKLREAA